MGMWILGWFQNLCNSMHFQVYSIQISITLQTLSVAECVLLPKLASCKLIVNESESGCRLRTSKLKYPCKLSQSNKYDFRAEQLTLSFTHSIQSDFQTKSSWCELQIFAIESWLICCETFLYWDVLQFRSCYLCAHSDTVIIQSSAVLWVLCDGKNARYNPCISLAANHQSLRVFVFQ